MEIIEKVRAVIGGGKHLLHEPWLKGNELAYVREVLASGHLSAGSWVNRLEDYFADFLGARYAIAVVNGTCGLHAMIQTLPKKDVYRIPSLTFVATANAFTYGGHKIKFVEHDGYCDCPVDVLGHPHFQIAGMRDSAQALGSKLHGRYIGSQGTCIFSFNQNKIITGGSGGIITTDDEGVAREIRHLITTARIEHVYKTAHDAIAYNYRMSDVTAAILVAQMEQLPLILKAKRALAMKYKEVFGQDFWDEPQAIGSPYKDINRDVSQCSKTINLQIPTLNKTDKAPRSNFWLNAVRVPEDELYVNIEALHKVGIMAKPLYEPIHRLIPYKDCEHDDLPRTEKLVRQVILVPSSPKLGMRYL